MRFCCPNRAAFSSIRTKLLLTFLGLAAITGCLGYAGIQSVIQSGRLVLQTYDGPLTAISHVRKAEVDLTAMRLAMMHRATGIDAHRDAADQQIEALSGAVEQDLAVARDHAGSERTAATALSALDDFKVWNALRRQLSGGAAQPAYQQVIDHSADSVMAKLAALTQAVTEDCVHDRVETIAAIHRYRIWSIAATGVALLIGTLLAAMLARHMVAPIAAASKAAGRIAAGDLNVKIVSESNDELGQLLATMSSMCDSLRAMMQREVTARRFAQGSLVNAIEGLNEGVALVDADGRVLLANIQLARFFPTHATALMEGGALPPQITAALSRSTDELQIADGSWLRLSRSDRPEGGFVLVASDITLLKQREAELNAAKVQAETANHAKTQFVTNMSHELRTPLTAIIGFSEIIASESLGPVLQPKYREFADDILHSGRHLLDVVNDMLDIAKLQSGMTELRLQHLPSHSIIDSAVRIVRRKAEQAGIALEVAIPRDLPAIRADHVRLRQILLNLLSNAIKFTPPGGRISIIAEQCDTGLAIIVRDTGVGMAPEDIPRVLQPFVQVDNSLSRQHGGTGLGLPLSKLFVDLHGGTFEMKSEPGKGTTVTIVMPTVIPAREAIAA